LIGSGTIAMAILSALRARDAADIAFILVEPRKVVPASLHGLPVFEDIEEALTRRADLVVEAATPDVVKLMAPRFLEHADFCAFSLTALADRAVETEVDRQCRAYGRRFLIPHGAVLGLDGLADGREALESVTVTTTKSAKSFGLSDDATGLVFDGSAREACMKFPRNVNVHAAVALGGLGFDKTRSRIMVAPNSPEMRHDIDVRGAGLAWSIGVTSRSLGGVTGSYTPLSAASTVLRLLNRGVGLLVG
jgi:aspartate dehydrogenase